MFKTAVLLREATSGPFLCLLLRAAVQQEGRFPFPPVTLSVRKRLPPRAARAWKRVNTCCCGRFFRLFSGEAAWRRKIRLLYQGLCRKGRMAPFFPETLQVQAAGRISMSPFFVQLTRRAPLWDVLYRGILRLFISSRTLRLGKPKRWKAADEASAASGFTAS